MPPMSLTFYDSLLPVWAFLTRVSTTPAADCGCRIRMDYSTLSHEFETMKQLSRDKLDCFRYATAGFTTGILDGYGRHMPTRPAP
jgi:hypothetical protein